METFLKTFELHCDFSKMKEKTHKELHFPKYIQFLNCN